MFSKEEAGKARERKHSMVRERPRFMFLKRERFDESLE
jgi:hypothetical protein